MRDTELYRHLLGLDAPWAVDRVELSTSDGRVDVWVTHPGRTRFACPDCERQLAAYDHAEERAWRHLDSYAFLTFLHARPPRVACPEHGVRQARLPWAEPNSRFTVLFERLAIDVLAACDVSNAAKLLRLSWDEAWHLMERAVARGLAVKALAAPGHVGVDEKAAGKGQDYITVISDLDAGTVEYIADERRQASLDGYFERFTPQQLERIEAVAMDMWEPFAASVRTHLSDPDSKIVFDRYHLMGYLTKAVDTVRKAENRALAAAGDKSLAGSKYLWLYSAPELTHPGDPCLRPRLPQSRALQDRDLLPPRWATALPGHPMTHELPGSALVRGQTTVYASPHFARLKPLNQVGCSDARTSEACSERYSNLLATAKKKGP